MKMLRKPLAFLVSLALLATVLLPCFTMVSFASGALGTVTYPQSWNTANFTTFQNQHKIYSGTDAITNGLTEMAWADAIESRHLYASGALRHENSDDWVYTDVSTEANKYLTTIINQTGKYRNFEMTVAFTMRDGSDYLYPGIVFGVHDPETWGTKNSGWYAGFAYNGAGSVKPAIEGYDTVTGQYVVDTPATFDDGTWDNTKKYTLKLKVDGTKATVSVVTQSNTGASFSHEFTVPAGYGGGNVGIVFRGATQFVWSAEIVDYGGKVEDPNAKEFDFSTTEAQSAAATDFDVYYSNEADKGTVAKVEFADHFQITDSALVHKPTETITSENFDEKVASNVTTLLYNKQKYRDFQMTVVAKGTADINRLGLLFGVQEPTAWKAAGYGFEAGVNYAINNSSAPYLNSFTKYGEDTNYVASPAAAANFSGWNNETTISLKVIGTTATLNVTTAGGTTDVATFTLGEDYLGGSVGLTFVPDSTAVYSIVITELGGTVEDPLPPPADYDFADSADREAVANDFDVYYSNNASSGLSKVEFADHFDVSGTELVHKPTEAIKNDDVEFWAQTGSNVTNLIYNKYQFRDFEISFTAQGTGDHPENSEYKGDWKYVGLVFGVQDPTKWDAEGQGYYSFLNFNLGGNSTFKMTSFAKYTEKEISYTPSPSTVPKDWGWKYRTGITLRVEGATATLTYTRQDGVTNTQTFYIDDYLGGYVGLSFIPDASKVMNITIKSLGGEVEEPEMPEGYVPVLSTSTYTFSNASSLEQFKSDFKFYYGSAADVSGLAEEDFGVHWQDALKHVKTNAYTNFSNEAEYNKFISTAIDNTQEYIDFNMKVKIGLDNGVYIFPSIVFGVQDETEWLTLDGGWIAGLFSQGMSDVRAGIQGYDYATDSITKDLDDDAYNNFYGLHWFWLEVTVKQGKVTVHINQPDNSNLDFSYTTDVPLGYKGGKIGLACRAANHAIWSIEIKDLGGDASGSEVRFLNAEEILATPVVEVPTATLLKDVVTPETVKVRCDSGEIFDIPVTWNIENYDRFTRGDYINAGVITDTANYEEQAIIYVGDLVPELTIKVTGDKDLDPITVACVGDSITYGGGSEILTNYPNRLQEILGGEYDVLNFGVNGACLLDASDNPYTYTDEYSQSMVCDPDIVLIMLGTNDSKTQNWVFGDTYEEEYLALYNEYKNLASNPTVYILTSPYVSMSNYSINKKVVAQEIVPLQKKMAEDNDYPLVDIFGLTEGQDAWYSDGIHPTSQGYNEMAYYIATQIALPQPIKNITLNKEKFNVLLGDTEEVTYEFSPIVISGDKTVNWTSSDENVATVVDGKITGVALGTATITAECQGKTDTVEITVIPKYETITIPFESVDELEDFDPYFAKNAANGMEAVENATDYWTVTEDKGLMRKESSLGSLAWGHTNVAALVYNVRKFHNFKVTVDMRRTEHGQWNYPLFTFGIKDPTRYYTQEDGGVTVFATAEGGLVVAGNVDGEQIYINSASPEAQGLSGYNRTGPHTFEILVEYEKVTVTMLQSKEGEPLAAPITVSLGETDMDGYIALYSRDNLCGFDNLVIEPLENRDPEKVEVTDVLPVNKIRTEVGTEAGELVLPETVDVIGEDSNTYSMPVTWDYDGYNRYIRDTYTIKGILKNTVVGTTKLLPEGKYAELDIEVYGDKDLLEEGELKVDFIGMSDLDDFKCYYTSDYYQDMTECNITEQWSIDGGILKRTKDIPNSSAWTTENVVAHSSSLIYTGRTYKNFEMEIDYMRDGGGFWWAMLVFGVQDPTKNPSVADEGGIAVYAEMEGDACYFNSDGFNGYDWKLTAEEYARHSVWHHLKVVVINGLMYVYIDDIGLAVFMLDDDRRVEGYVGIMCNQQWASFKNFSVKPLPDTASTNTEGFDASDYPELTYAGDAETVDANLLYANAHKRAEAGVVAEAASYEVKNGGFITVAIIASLFAVGYVFGGKRVSKVKGK